MKVSDFKVGLIYKILTKDWEAPDGEIIPGKEYVKTILEPANKDNSLFDGETPPDSVIAEWQEFLRVKCSKSKKPHLLHPRSILTAELLN
ncbi:MAG: hypothetical protein V7749_01040 [Cocleimonas sp.]